MTVFKLPDLGEGLPDAEIHEWHVKAGDRVQTDQPMVSMETAKAVVEVPAPFAGTIKKLHGEVGDIIATGSALIEFAVEEEQPSDKTADSGTVAGAIEVGNEIVEETATVLTRKRSKTERTKITPAVRALAQRLAVDITDLQGSGPGGMLTVEDIKQAQATNQQQQPPYNKAVEPLRGARRMMAQSMAAAHASVVAVTIFDEVSLHQWQPTEDITYRLIRAIVRACKEEPALNAHFHEQQLARELFSKVNLGLAIDTSEGLFVPVIHEANTLVKDNSLTRATVNELKEQVNARTIAQEKLQGATITLSNFGMFAGKFATPVVVPPQVAIIGSGKLQQQVVAVEDEVRICKVLPLSLTFDHRAVTGGEATRFMAALLKDLSSS